MEEIARLSTEARDDALADLDQRTPAEVVRTIVSAHADVVASAAAAAEEIGRLAELTAERLGRGGRVVYVGAGASGRVGVADAAEWGPTFSVPDGSIVALLAGADETPGSAAEASAEDDAEAGAAAVAALDPTEHDVVIAVSASGRTPFAVAAIGVAKRAGALTAVVAAHTGSPLAAECDVAIEVPVGAEAVAGSTRLKAATAQKLVLNAFSTAVMVRRGRILGNLMAGMRIANGKLRERGKAICVQATGATPEQAAAAIEQAQDELDTAVVMLAAGLDAATARAKLERHDGHIRAAIENWS